MTSVCAAASSVVSFAPRVDLAKSAARSMRPSRYRGYKRSWKSISLAQEARWTFEMNWPCPPFRFREAAETKPGSPSSQAVQCRSSQSNLGLRAVTRDRGRTI